MRIVTDIFRVVPRQSFQVEHHLPISGYHIREAGSTAVQEVAFTLAMVSPMSRAALDAGLSVR